MSIVSFSSQRADLPKCPSVKRREELQAQALARIPAEHRTVHSLDLIPASYPGAQPVGQQTDPLYSGDPALLKAVGELLCLPLHWVTLLISLALPREANVERLQRCAFV